jgi:hypothetical protein
VDADRRSCARGDGHDHGVIVAFGHYFRIFGCEKGRHLVIREGSAPGDQPDPDKRGELLSALVTASYEPVYEPTSHHGRLEVVLRRRAPGVALCVDPECDLSGRYAHLGECAPCGCPLEHAIEECSERDDSYERTYRLLQGVRGTRAHFVKAQLARVEAAFHECDWTMGEDCAVAWIGSDVVGLVMACVDGIPPTPAEVVVAEAWINGERVETDTVPAPAGTHIQEGASHGG